MRTIELNINPDEVGLAGYEDIQVAIGYLSSWAIASGSFPVLKIWPDGKSDMIANYYKPDGTLGYQIGAIWHGDHYGFHS